MTDSAHRYLWIPFAVGAALSFGYVAVGMLARPEPASTEVIVVEAVCDERAQPRTSPADALQPLEDQWRRSGTLLEQFRPHLSAAREHIRGCVAPVGGSPRWVRMAITPDEQGGQAFVVVVSDITDDPFFQCISGAAQFETAAFDGGPVTFVFDLARGDHEPSVWSFDDVLGADESWLDRSAR